MNRPSLFLVAGASLLAALAVPAVAQQAADTTRAVAASAPGKAVIAASRTVVATVEAIDAAKREVTLKGPKGNLVPVTAGPEVRNFDQIKVGDSVVVKYAEALSLTLKKDGKELRGSTQSADGARAAVGAAPGAVVGQEVTVIADVTAVNAKTQTVTLKGPQRTVDLRVPDKGQFKMIKVGDQIEATYAQAVALSVQPAKK